MTTWEKLYDVKFYTFYTVHYGKFFKNKPTNAPVVYIFSPIYLHLHVSVVIRPTSWCSILKSIMSYIPNVCIRPRYSFWNIQHPDDGRMTTETCRCK